MADTRVETMPPRTADQVVLRHDSGGPAEVSISLADIAAALSSRPHQGTGLGSRVWRFAPLALARQREEREDDIFYAFKWVNLTDDVRAAHLPRELSWLKRLDSGHFPHAVAHAMLREDSYLLVSEWVEGRNLALHAPEVIADLLVADAFNRFCADLTHIAETLRAAGIAHSDIWEPNIIVRNLRAVLIDFGWARPLGQAPARDNFHEPDDERAVYQLLLRLGALRRMIAPRVREHLAGGPRHDDAHSR